MRYSFNLSGKLRQLLGIDEAHLMIREKAGDSSQELLILDVRNDDELACSLWARMFG